MNDGSSPLALEYMSRALGSPLHHHTGRLVFLTAN